ncbi:MAG TPA: hypothetical protein VEQ58_13075 [Polyangiaceae bacterium]|nr:hypothetical protein [Polyangiaceae bacterium]
MNEVEQALRAARQEFEPSRSDRERVRRRLRTSAAGLGIAASLTAKVSAAATSLKLTLLFFGGMFVTLVGSSVVVAVMDRPAPSSSAHHASAPRAAAPLPSAVLAPAPPAPAAPSAAPTPDRHAPHAPAASAPSSDAPASAPSGAGLEAELALLREARRASASGNVGLAKQLLDRLDLEHPQSSLLEERSALRAVTDCQGATAFFRRYPASVYAAKVRRACHIEAAPSSVPSSASFENSAELL